MLKSAAMAAVAAGVVAIYVLSGGGTGSSVAFAQVVEKLRSAETLSFDVELVSQADGKLISRNHNYYLAPGKTRTDMSDGKGESGYVVFDTNAGKVLMVDSRRKLARVSPILGEDGKDLAASEIQGLQTLGADEGKPLPEKIVDGVKAKGFEIVHATDVTTVWADAATGAPVRVEIVQKNYPSGPVVQTWTNIKFDAPLDETLFSLDPPAGVTSIPFLPINFKMTAANFTASFLKLYADHMDGEFPPRLQDAIKLLAEKIKPQNPNAAPSEVGLQAAFYGAGMMVPLIYGEEGKDWQYFPGAKLGEREMLVYWVRDKRENQYLAVYGDLRVEPIAKKKLPAGK